MAHPLKQVQFKTFLFQNKLLSVLDDKALIALANTLTSKVIAQAVAVRGRLHSRDASSGISILTHQGDIVDIVPARH